MTDNVRKVFDMLGVEPNEEFKIEGLLYNLCIDSNLNLYAVLSTPTGNMKVNNKLMLDIIKGEYIIIKLPKEPKKKKLRDLTNDEYTKWKVKNCVNVNRNCTNCMFRNANCSGTNLGWVNNKEVYSDTFLDQEIEVEE